MYMGFFPCFFFFFRITCFISLMFGLHLKYLIFISIPGSFQAMSGNCVTPKGNVISRVILSGALFSFLTSAEKIAYGWNTV